MARSKVFDNLTRMVRLAEYCERQGMSTQEGCERAAASERQRTELRGSRREFLKSMGSLAALSAVGSVAGSFEEVFGAQASGSDVKIAIVGGESYADLPNHQLTWETNPSKSGAIRSVLTDYSSGLRGANLNPSDPQGEAAQFLGDLDQVFPGALASVRRDAQGRFLVHLEHWPSNPLTRGSYTCYLPGQFTSIAGNEGKPIGNLYFAGEHANSFYEWQGFMEGAALSGIAAARAILQGIKAGVLG